MPIPVRWDVGRAIRLYRDGWSLRQISSDVGVGRVARQLHGTGFSRFLPASWDHLICQSWDHPACLRWVVLVRLVDCPRHDQRRGGQRGWVSGRSVWSRCVRCCGPGWRVTGCGRSRSGRGWTGRRPAGMSLPRRRPGCPVTPARKRLTDELVGLVVEAVRPARPNGHGAVVGGAAGRGGTGPRLGPRRRGRRTAARPVVAGEDRAAAGPSRGGGAVPDVAPVRGRAVRLPGRFHHGPGRRRGAGGGVPDRLRPARPAPRPRDRAAVDGCTR